MHIMHIMDKMFKKRVPSNTQVGKRLPYFGGKGDVSFFAQMYAEARQLGREDDVLVLVFTVSNKNTRCASNTLNPFSSGR